MRGPTRTLGVTLIAIAGIAGHRDDIPYRYNRAIRRRAAPTRLVPLTTLRERAEDTPFLFQLREFLLEFGVWITAFAQGHGPRLATCAAGLGPAVFPQARPQG